MFQYVDELFRWLNIVLAIWALGRLSWAAWHKWRHWYTDKEKILWYALAMSAFALGFAAMENLVQNNPAGGRTFLTTFALVFIIWGTYMRDQWSLIFYREEKK